MGGGRGGGVGTRGGFDNRRRGQNDRQSGSDKTYGGHQRWAVGKEILFSTEFTVASAAMFGLEQFFYFASSVVWV